MVRILSHVRGDRTVVTRLCRIRLTLLLGPIKLMVQPSELGTHFDVLLGKHMDFVAKMLVLVATRAAVLVEMADVIGCCNSYSTMTF